MMISTFFIWTAENMFTLSHPTAPDKYEEGFPAADGFALASNAPKQLAADRPRRSFFSDRAKHFCLDSPKLQLLHIVTLQ
jgi:hypothetical protein